MSHKTNELYSASAYWSLLLLERHWHSNVPVETAQYAPENQMSSKDITSGGVGHYHSAACD